MRTRQIVEAHRPLVDQADRHVTDLNHSLNELDFLAERPSWQSEGDWRAKKEAAHARRLAAASALRGVAEKLCGDPADALTQQMAQLSSGQPLEQELPIDDTTRYMIALANGTTTNK